MYLMLRKWPFGANDFIVRLSMLDRNKVSMWFRGQQRSFKKIMDDDGSGGNELHLTL
jgi:hypothetical protein